MTSINTFTSGTAFRPGPPPARRGGEDPMNAVAEKLRLDRDQLQGQLDSGRSLNEGQAKGELSGIGTDETKLNRLSALLDTDTTQVSSLTSAKELISMFRDKGVDLGQLRSVFNSGDLLDVMA